MKIPDRGEYQARGFKIELPDGPYVILQTGYEGEPWTTTVKRASPPPKLWEFGNDTFLDGMYKLPPSSSYGQRTLINVATEGQAERLVEATCDNCHHWHMGTNGRGDAMKPADPCECAGMPMSAKDGCRCLHLFRLAVGR